MPHVHVHAPHELSETSGHGKRGRDRPDRSERMLELGAVLLLSLTTLATAWSGYQAARWSGEQSQHYARASAVRIKAQQQATRGRPAADRRPVCTSTAGSTPAKRATRSSRRSTSAASARSSSRPSAPGSRRSRSPTPTRSPARSTCRSTGTPELAKAKVLDVQADDLYAEGTAGKTMHD